MKLTDIFNNKTLKQKAKTQMLSELVGNKEVSIDALIAFAKKADDTTKATCIESLEFVTKQNSSIATEKCLQFVTQTLKSEAPRVKWESAKVVGNIACLFPAKLDNAIKNLLTNTEYDGTVVRWAAAFALSEILKLKTKYNKDLLPAIETICKNEKDNAIKKKYLDAIKKINK